MDSKRGFKSPYIKTDTTLNPIFRKESNKLLEKSGGETMKSCRVKIERLPILNLIGKIKADPESESDIIKSGYEKYFYSDKLSEKSGEETSRDSHVKIDSLPILHLINKIKADPETGSNIIKSEYGTDYNGENSSEKSGKETIRVCHVKIEHLPNLNLIPRIEPDLKSVSDIIKSEYETNYYSDKLSEKSGEETTRVCCVKIDHLPILNSISKIKPDPEVSETGVLMTEFNQPDDIAHDLTTSYDLKLSTSNDCNQTSRYDFSRIRAKEELPATLKLVAKIEPGMKEEFHSDSLNSRQQEGIGSDLTSRVGLEQSLSNDLSAIHKYNINEINVKGGFPQIKLVPLIKSEVNEKSFQETIESASTNTMTLENNQRNLVVEGDLKSQDRMIFTCDYCEMNYASIHRLRNHIARHMDEKIVKCNLCAKGYNCDADLEKNVKTHDCKSGPKYTCDVCNKVIRTKHMLKQHLSLHQEARPYQCLLCPSKFKIEDYLRRHTLYHKQKNCPETAKEFCCAVCGKRFGTKLHMERHILIHMNEKLFECHVCMKRFNLESYLKKHLESHLPTPVDPKYTCNICNKSLKNSDSLKNHIRITHDDKRPYHCSHCSYKSKKKSGLKAHKAIHENKRLFQCSLCPKRFNFKAGLKMHMETHNHKDSSKFEHVCPMCEKPFKCIQYLKKHMKFHDQNQFSCSYCDFKTKYENSLKKHLAFHLNRRQLQCPHCPKTYDLKRNLRKHVWDIHFTVKTDQNLETIRDIDEIAANPKLDFPGHLRFQDDPRPFLCTYCPATFKRQNSLNNHIAIHKNEILFKCPTCHIKFDKKPALRKHLKIHGPKEPAEHKCVICNKTFARKDTLKQHIESHDNPRSYQCSLCPSFFKTKGGLKRHLDCTHYNERRFKCTLCPKRFNYKDRLDDHTTTHNLERKYVCEHCGALFKSKSLCARHKKTHFKKLKKNLNCKICEEKFYVRAQLETHLTNHTDEEKEKVILHYTCDFCGKKYSGKKQLAAHIKLKHSQQY